MSLRSVLSFACRSPGFFFSRSSDAGCNLKQSERVGAAMPDENVGKNGEMESEALELPDDKDQTSSELEVGKKVMVEDQLMDGPSGTEAVVEVSTLSASVEEPPENSGDDCICLGEGAPPKEICSEGDLTVTSEEVMKGSIPADDDPAVSEGNNPQNAVRLTTLTCNEMPLDISAPKHADQVPEQDSRADNDVRDKQLCERAPVTQISHCGAEVDRSDLPQERIQSTVVAVTQPSHCVADVETSDLPQEGIQSSVVAVTQPSHCEVDVEISDLPQDTIQSSVPASGLDLDDKGMADEIMVEDRGPSYATNGNSATRESLQESPSDVTDPQPHPETPQPAEVVMESVKDSNAANESPRDVLCKNVPCLPRKVGKAGDVVGPNDCSLEGSSLVPAYVQELDSDSEQSMEAFPKHRRTLRRKRVVSIIDSEDEAVPVSDSDPADSESASENSRSFFDDEAEESPPHFGDDDVFPSDCDKPDNSDTDESFEAVGDFLDAEAEESLGDEEEEGSKSDTERDTSSHDDDEYADSDYDRSSEEDEDFRHSTRERSSSSDPTYIPEDRDYFPEVQQSGARVDLADQKEEAEKQMDREAEKCVEDTGDAQEENREDNRHSNKCTRREEKSTKDGENRAGSSRSGIKTNNDAMVMVLQSQVEEEMVDAEAGKSNLLSAKRMAHISFEAIRRVRLIDRLLTSGAITEDEATLLRSGRSEGEDKQVDSLVEVSEHIQQYERPIEGAERLSSLPQLPALLSSACYPSVLEVPVDHTWPEECRKKPKKRRKKLSQVDEILIDEDLRVDAADETENQHRKIDNDDNEDGLTEDVHKPKEMPKKKGKGPVFANLVECKEREALLAALEVPEEWEAKGVLFQGSSLVNSTVVQSVVEVSQEYGSAGEAEATREKKRGRKRGKRLTDPEVVEVKYPGPVSVQWQGESVEKSVSASPSGFAKPEELLADPSGNSVECQASLEWAETRRGKPRRKKKKSEIADVETQQTKGREEGRKEKKDNGDAGTYRQPTEEELVPQNSMDGRPHVGVTEEFIWQDASGMEVPTKKRKKRQGGGSEPGYTGDHKFSTVEEEPCMENREKGKKKRKNLLECGERASDFSTAERKDIVLLSHHGTLLTKPMVQVSVNDGEEELIPDRAEEFQNQKTKKRKKKRHSEGTKVDREEIVLEGAEVCSELWNGKTDRKKKRAKDRKVDIKMTRTEAASDSENAVSLMELQSHSKRKRRKDGEPKGENSSSDNSDGPKLARSEPVTASATAPRVKKSKKLEGGKRRDQQSENVGLEEFLRSDGTGQRNDLTDIPVRQEIPSIPGPLGHKHKKKKVREGAGSGLDVITWSDNDNSSQQEGIEALWKRYIAESPAKPAKDPSSVRKKKKKSERVEQDATPTGSEAEANLENEQGTLENLWKKYIAQTPEKLRHSPFKQRVPVSGKGSKVAKTLLPLEDHIGAPSPQRKKKKRKL